MTFQLRAVVRVHPLLLTSPSSGCGSRMTNLASRTTGTDALERLPGSHRLASGVVWYGERNEEGGEGSIRGTGIRASLCLTSLLFLLGEVLHRQPRAVYKYWVGVAWALLVCW